ncbi:Carbonic anhydrase 6 [Myotis brandtii]|uniref:Carbonic anhydrase n=1 Tax=Myotis brandtii TaxID=109478 RepID=S7N6G2_MYOBR|nr:PREDICTED: carbonic anhydrase 6 [Myotis brandtii]EPQ12764.1 Carbonic anhydrase 6 [Myotis brandtii]
MRTLITLALLLLGALAHQDWTYTEGPNDETHWPEEYPTCGGDRQSPIDVQRKKVRYNPSLKALNLTGYEAQSGDFLMTNNGHTVQISLPPTMRMTTAEGTEYIAVQMHFHWGGAASEISGSEHTIDGLRYAAEIHVVHYNSKYESYDIAKDAPDGLAVLAALIEVKDYEENTYYSNFISHLEDVMYLGQSTVLSSLDVQDMLPTNLRFYYTYEGSLTTPPCTENVRWFLLADFVPLSKAQVTKLENSLLDHQDETIHNVYRKAQPLNDRVVEANFEYHSNYQYALGSELQSYLRKIDSKLDDLLRSEKKAKRRCRYY